jgi:hypothetical protein
MIRVIALASLPLRRPSVVASRLASRIVSQTNDVVLNGVEFCRMRIARLSNPYHPERHYMRGPGPKWREKHPDA